MKTVKQMVKDEMTKQIARTMRADILTENVKNVYDANKLVRQFAKDNSPLLTKAKKTLKLAESRLNEFFEEEWELEYGPEEMDDMGHGELGHGELGHGELEGGFEEAEVDNSPLYDSLLCLMECSKELYMNIDLDSDVDPMVVSKIQQAEALIRTASEMYKLASSEAEESENEALSGAYIESGESFEDYEGEGEFEDDDEEIY